MSTEDLVFLSAMQQAELLRRREVSPVELTRACLDQIASLDDRLRAWITVDETQALESARQAESEIAAGDYRGPLHGLPWGIKDQAHALGFPTTLGTRVLDPEETVPPTDATVVSKLRDAGAVLIGKQNLHEFGKGGTIDFPFGQPRNPWNTEYDASGSSTGSGIAPASGMCSFSIGEDTGGSIRGPASYNGVVGLRPTFGRVSRHGGVMHAYTSDTFGPITRTVEDCAAVLTAICGRDHRDPLTSNEPVPDFVAAMTDDVRGKRIGVVREMVAAEDTDPQVRAAVMEAARLFEANGAIVEEVSIPLAKWAVPLQLLSADADVASWFLATYLRDRYDRFDVGTRTRLAASNMIPASVYNRAMRARVIVRAQILEVFESFDALIAPTNVTPPMAIGDAKETVSEDGADRIRRLLQRRMSVYPFSLANVPALAVPAGFSDQGMPLSLQIAGRPFDEVTVFSLGRFYESRMPWEKMRPAFAQSRGAEQRKTA